MTHSSLKGWEWIAVIALLFITALLIVVDFHEVPPGVIHDEVLNYLNADLIQQGDIRALYPFGGGREALYLLMQAASFTLMGDNLIGLRWPSFAMTLLLVAGVFVVARRLFGRWVALFAATAVATSFWVLLFARLGTRVIALAAFTALTAYAFMRALEAQDDRRWRWSLAGGTLLGASLYTYSAGLILPAVITGWLVILALTGHMTAGWKPLLAGILLAGVMALPLILNWGQPDATARADAISGPLTALRAGDPGPILSNLLPVAGMFTVQGDVGSEFNNPDQPAIPTLPMAVLFYGGLGVTLIGVMRPTDSRFPAYVLCLLWFVGLLVPTLATQRPVAPYRTIGVVGVVYVFPALVLDWLGRGTRWRYAPHAAVLLGVLTLTAHTGHTLEAYFSTWRTNEVVRFLYQDDYRQIATYLDEHPQAVPTAVGGLTPAVMDPASMLLLMHNDERAQAIHHFDPQQAFVLPPLSGAEASQTIIPDFVPLHPALDQYVQATFVDTVSQQDAFTIYHVGGFRPIADFRVAYGGAIELNGIDQVGGELTPGGSATFITMWQPTQPLDQDLRIFFHVVDAEGTITTQTDSLGVPAQQWVDGQIFYQVHEVFPQAEGPYTISVGLYDVVSGQRLGDVFSIPAEDIRAITYSE